jgi:hypothetical protein
LQDFVRCPLAINQSEAAVAKVSQLLRAASHVQQVSQKRNRGSGCETDSLALVLRGS